MPTLASPGSSGTRLLVASESSEERAVTVAPGAPPDERLFDGRYELLVPVGHGGAATVWRAHHRALNRDVALKFLDAHLGTKDALAARLAREAQIASLLASPSVMQVYDVGVASDGRPYIAMELLEGETLRQMLARHGPLGVTQTVRIVARVCAAVERIHAAGIIHRDIKPENVFLALTRSGRVRVKILDFGIARPSRGSDVAATLDSPDASGGTPMYMAPERVIDDAHSDERVDVWSIGVVAFRCLTGRPPIRETDVPTLLRRVCTEDAPRLSSLLPTAAPALDAWMARALARDPRDRFPSARAAGRALVAAARVQPPKPRASIFDILGALARG